MADRMLMISWGSVVRGREERALEVFNESVGLYGRLQQEGRIDGFDVALLVPNGGVDGYFQLQGSSAQLADVKEDERFKRAMIDASLIVEDLRITDGYCNEGVAQQMGMWQEAIEKVPQATS